MGLDLLPLLAVTALVMAVPGPSVLFAVTQRLQRGPTAGFAAVLGLETGLLVHVLAACLGVSALVAASPGLLTILRLLGAGYLAYLGVRQLGVKVHWPAGRAGDRLAGVADPIASLPDPTPTPTPVASTVQLVAAPVRPATAYRQGLWPIYRAGVLVDLLNPKSLIFFLALLPQFVPGAITWSAGTLLVAGVVTLGLLFDGGYAALAGGMQRRGLTVVGRWGPSIAGWCFLGLAAVTLVG